jgi:glycosyltransferase involved in cell wall biosynthesis
VDSLHAAFVVDADSFGVPEAQLARLLRFLPSWVRPSLVVSREVAAFFGRRTDTTVVPLARGRSWAPDVQAVLAELAPDVVHVNLADPGGNIAALRAAESVAPTVVTLHANGPLPADVWDVYQRLAAAFAPLRSLVHTLTDLGVPAHRVQRIRPGVEIPAAPVAAGARAPVVIGAVAPLVFEQGLDLLVQAVATLTRRGRAAHLLIAGDGPERSTLIDRARGLPIRFVGPVADAAPLLRRLDVFCFPARQELPPSPLLNAMAHGLPCLTTAVGDTVEALAGAAAIVPADDVHALTEGLDRLVTEGGLRAKLALAARELATRDFDVRRVAAEVGEALVAAARV